MNLLNKIFKRNNCIWYYDIPSSNKFLSSKRAKNFDIEVVASFIDLLCHRDDEITIEVPNESKYKNHLLIWGESSTTVTIERVEPRKCGSYWLSASKVDIKELLKKIELVAENPTKYGLVFKEWE